jgi:hypothetical protein
MRIEVTEHLINIGVRRSSFACPVALALQRATGRRWEVSNTQAENLSGGRFNLPREVSTFTHDFDLGRPVAPLTFELPDG